MLNNLLIYRIIILDALGAAVAFWAYQRGYLNYLGRDVSGISYVILSVFALGLILAYLRSFKVSAAFNKLKRRQKLEVNKAKFLAKGEHIEVISSLCVGLGFFGTVVGIISMLFGGGGISSDGSVNSITAIIDQILAGGGVAFITTAVGLLTSLWLDIHAVMLKTAAVCMLEDAEAQRKTLVVNYGRSEDDHRA